MAQQARLTRLRWWGRASRSLRFQSGCFGGRGRGAVRRDALLQ